MAVPEFHVYDSNQVAINVLGVLVESGFAEGEIVRVVMTNERFKPYEGADGGVSRADTHSKLATIELRLAQTSPTNAALAAAFAAGVVGPIEVADLNGASLHVASKCWITKQPDVMYDREVKERVWHFTAADMDSFSAGQVV
jgi:hypothetical protein